MERIEYGSKNLIGKVKEVWKDFFRPDRRWDVWKGFYNGWIEGRADMLREIRESNMVAYEFHNYESGHCYVDYIKRPDLEDGGEYKKIPLHYV